VPEYCLNCTTHTNILDEACGLHDAIRNVRASIAGSYPLSGMGDVHRIIAYRLCAAPGGAGTVRDPEPGVQE